MSVNSTEVLKPFFSVVVNCRNSEKYLKDCLDTIQKQSFSDFEVVIWDNMSSDDTVKITKEFEKSDNRFKFYIGKESLPLGAARNCAVSKSTGRYLAFLDSDDLWDPEYLYHHYQAIKKFGKDSFGAGIVQEISDEFKILTMSSNVTNIVVFNSPKQVFTKLLKGNYIYFSSLVIPKDFFSNNTGFRSDFVQAEDYEMLLRLAKKLPCYTAGLCYYRVHSGNATNNQEENLYQESIEILNSYMKWLPAKVHRLSIIGRYYTFLAPLKPKIRKNKILLTGVSYFDILLARSYLIIIKQLKIIFLKISSLFVIAK